MVRALRDCRYRATSRRSLRHKGSDVREQRRDIYHSWGQGIRVGATLCTYPLVVDARRPLQPLVRQRQPRVSRARLHFPVEDGEDGVYIKSAPSFDEQIAASETTNDASSLTTNANE